MSDNIPDGFMIENGHVVMTDEQMDKAFRIATERAIEDAKIKGLPYTITDENGVPCLLYPDGRREYV